LLSDCLQTTLVCLFFVCGIYVVFIAPGAALLQVDVEPFVGAAPRRDGCGGFAGHADVVQHAFPGLEQDLANRQPDEACPGCPDGRLLPGSGPGWKRDDVGVVILGAVGCVIALAVRLSPDNLGLLVFCLWYLCRIS
jgi:hypothetical protein